MIRSSRSFLAVGLLSIVAACSETPPAQAPVASAVEAPALPAPPSLPDVVDDLATLVPADAGFVVELPSIDRAAEVLTTEQRIGLALVRPLLDKNLAQVLELDPDVVHDLVESFDRVEVFGDTTQVAGVARFKERAAVEAMLGKRAPIASESTPGVRAAYQVGADSKQRFVWYPKPRILVWASSAAAAELVDRIGSKQSPSFASSPRRLPDAVSVRGYGDLARLVAKEQEASRIVGPGSSLRSELGYDGKTVRSKTELSLVGERIPRLAAVFAPGKPALASRLPEETMVFGSFSTARRSGKTIRDLIVEIARLVDAPALGALAELRARAGLGLGLDELDALLGDEAVFGALGKPRQVPGSTPNLDDAAAFAIVSTRDDARARKLIAAIGKTFGGKDAPKEYKVTVTATAVRFTPTSKTAPSARVELHKGAVLVMFGSPVWLDRVGRAFDTGERTLGASAALKASGALDESVNAVLWVDMPALSKSLGFAGTWNTFDRPGVLRGRLGPTDRGLDLTLDGVNGAEVFVVGVGAGLGVYGVRRYLGASKSAEAKNTVGAIARDAVSAFERELPDGNQVAHRLCKSARAVPAQVPKGTKYASVASDYESGDAQSGWRCLKFSMSSPQYYQYEYRQGGPYKGPKRGGPDPGPNGFEVSAEGDLNGDGKTSLFTRTGTIDPKTHFVKLSPDIFVSDELE